MDDRDAQSRCLPTINMMAPSGVRIMTNTYYFRPVLAEMTVVYSPAVSTPALWAIGEENPSGIPVTGNPPPRIFMRPGSPETAAARPWTIPAPRYGRGWAGASLV